MKPEVTRRRRIPCRRIVAGIAIAYSGWWIGRVLEGLERADRAAEVQRGPRCTTTASA